MATDEKGSEPRSSRLGSRPPDDEPTPTQADPAPALENPCSSVSICGWTASFRFILEAAMELPAKYAKHAKANVEAGIGEALWLHPAGERCQQQKAGAWPAAFRVFSVFSGPFRANGYKSTAAFRFSATTHEHG